ncbi:MAG: hypothetical protein ACK5M0_10890 [Bacteroidales bacterium]
MKKSLISILIVFISVMSNNIFAQTFSGGSGSIGNPWQISSKADLITLSNNVNNGTNNYAGKYFIVTQDINMSATGTFNPIGDANHSFRGNFDGNNYKIRNFRYINISNDQPDNINIGLFGHTLNAYIQNVSMVVDSIYFNVNKIKNSNYGLLIAYAEGTTINNCNVGDTTKIYLEELFSNTTIGGLVGYAYNCTFELSYSFCNLDIYCQGDNNGISIGGLIGKAVNCTIDNCYTRNDIQTDDQQHLAFVGGLVGTTQNSSFSNSYSAPTAFDSGFPFTGVIVSSGSGSTNTTFDNCYYLIDSVLVHAGSNVGTGLTEDQMLDDSFIDSLNQGQNPPIWESNGGLPAIFPPIEWPGGGSGTEADPFRINYVKDLLNLSEITKTRSFRNYFLRLEKDISFNNGDVDSSNFFTPVGNVIKDKPFSGNLNGNMFVISNYRYNNSDSNNIGIFAYIKNATIKKLGITNIYIKAKDNVGGLIGEADAENIIDSCFVYGFISGVNNVGGLVGYSTTASCNINRSFTNTTIDAQTNVGGIAGSYKGSISNSYSNSEIYSSTPGNDNVGGIIGLAVGAPVLNKVYSVCKIIRNGTTNTHFGKITGSGSIGNLTNIYSRDIVFVNCNNISSNPPGNAITIMSNADLRSGNFVSTLGNTYWKADYTDNINDGYPILSYQKPPTKLNTSDFWQNASWSNDVPTASTVVIIPNGLKLKINASSAPKCAYIKIENGGELNNTTNLNFFGEYNRELYAGKWNLIGLSTNTRILSCLFNYTDSIYLNPFVKRFNYAINNWSTTSMTDLNTQINYGEGVLVMPNYSLDDRMIIKSKIVSKGVLFNNQNFDYSFNNSAANKFVALANCYPASINVTQNNPPIIGNTAGLIQGNLVYVYDANTYRYNNNLQTNSPITSIKPSEGFLISASIQNGTFTFNKSQINNTSGAKNTIKSDLIYVNANSNDNEREAFLEFNEDADNAFDFEDGLMLFGNNYNSVEPYFTLPNSEIENSKMNLIKDAFSTLPYNTELNLRSQKNNEVSLNFSNIPFNIHVYLLDSLLNKAQYLNEEPNYNLQVNEGDNAKRLYVLFSYYKEDINEFFKPEVAQEIKIWNYNNNLNIEGRDLIRYELFDIMGNKLLEEEILDDRFKTQLDLESGIYIVRAFSSSSSKAQKISIRRK